MLAFRLSGLPDSRLPLYLYGVGTQEEKSMNRTEGFPVFQLFLLRGGGGQFRIPGEGTWSMGTGQLFVLEPGSSHEYVSYSRTKGELGYIGIGGDAAEAILQSAGLLHKGPLSVSNVDHIWSHITDLWQAINQGTSRMWSTSALLYQFILDMAQSIYIPAGEVVLAGTHRAEGVDSQLELDPGMEGLKRAVALMNTHYQDDLLLKHVADAAGYSVQHLNRLFHQHYGVTGHQYMQRLRLQKASAWLEQHPQATVREAAESIGMEVNYFIRMFKREFGETPGQEMKHRNQRRLQQETTRPNPIKDDRTSSNL